MLVGSMSSRSRFFIVALAAALSLAAPPVVASAQPSQPPPTKAQEKEAATRFKRGLDLFKDGDYQAALIEFRRAYELAPNYNVLYNIGQVYFQLQDYPGALNALERYLNDGGDKIPKARRDDVQSDIDKLKARVATIEITTKEPGSEVSIDDVAVGKSPLAKPVMVSAGRHKISVCKAGDPCTTQVVEVASAENVKIAMDATEKEVTPAAPAEPPASPEPQGSAVSPAPPTPVEPQGPPPERAKGSCACSTTGRGGDAIGAGLAAIAVAAFARRRLCHASPSRRRTTHSTSSTRV
jgi:MYXO-CTERM domain-containing protein